MNKDNENALKKLAELSAKGCHMLIPSTQHIEGIDDGFSAIIETVKLDPHPKNKDVYPHEGAHFDNYKLIWKEGNGGPAELVRIAKRGLDRLALCAGLIWSPSLSRLERDPSAKKRVQYVAVGGVRKPDGSPHFVQATYWMDLEVEKKKLEMQYRDNKNADYLIPRDLLQKEVNMEKLCESGAKDRVVRELLGVGKPYTLKELELEFVMVRVVPKFDLNDEYTRKRLIDIKLAAMSGVYGMGPAALLPEQTKPTDVVEVATPIDIPADEGENDDAPNFTEPAAQQAPAGTIPDFSDTSETTTTGADTLESRLTDFGQLTASEKEATLRRMAAAKNYNLDAWLKKAKVAAIRELPEDARVGLFKYIFTLPDRKAA